MLVNCAVHCHELINESYASFEVVLLKGALRPPQLEIVLLFHGFITLCVQYVLIVSFSLFVSRYPRTMVSLKLLRFMLRPSVLSLIGVTIPPTVALSCWRDTKCTGPASPSFSGLWDTNNLSYVFCDLHSCLFGRDSIGPNIKKREQPFLLHMSRIEAILKPTVSQCYKANWIPHRPESRLVSPVTILRSDNSIQSNYPGTAILNSTSSLLVFDFGKEVGGIVTVNYTAKGSGTLGLAFTEARNWTGSASDSSNGAFGPDGSLTATIATDTEGSYTVPDAQLRGGFRYLSLFAATSDAIEIEITAVNLEISFQPSWPNLRAYGGYFHSNDDLINRIWYSGAYTLQTNAVPPNTGREFPLVSTGWKNDANLGTNGSSVFVDGSKRDRASWAGDLCIAIPSALVSTGDFESSKNAIQLQYDGQVRSFSPLLNYQNSFVSAKYWRAAHGRPTYQ